jgi:hypothetical protein
MLAVELPYMLIHTRHGAVDKVAQALFPLQPDLLPHAIGKAAERDISLDQEFCLPDIDCAVGSFD